MLELPYNFGEAQDKVNQVQGWILDRAMDISRFFLFRSGLFLSEPVKALPVIVVIYVRTSRARLFLIRSSISNIPRHTDNCFYSFKQVLRKYLQKSQFSLSSCSLP